MNEDHKKSFSEQFIDELQALEEGTKRKILIITTIFAMAIILYLWTGYFGSLISAIPQTQPPVAQNDQSDQTATGTSTAQNGPSFFQSVQSGMANIYGTLRGPGQYDVTPTSTNQ